MTKVYLEHLLAFSGDVFANARNKLIQGLSDEELDVLIQGGVKRCTTRKAREQLGLGILELINEEEGATSELPATHTSLRHSALPTLAKVAQVSSTSIPGTAPQRVQPKRKAAENLDADDDRVHKAAILNMGNDTLSDLISDDEDDEDWEGTTPNHGNTQQSEALAHTNDDINIIDIRSTSSVIPVLRIGVWLPSVTGREHWQPLDHLSGSGGYDIHAKFMTHFAFDDAKQAAYGAVARNANSYSDGGRCLNMTIWQSGKGESVLEKAYGNDRRACDTCIRTKRLCVQIRADALGAKFCVMPLPESRREGRALESIAAWVVG